MEWTEHELTLGARSIAYRVAMVAAMLELLSGPNDCGGGQRAKRNAYLESCLINLRSLADFLTSGGKGGGDQGSGCSQKSSLRKMDVVPAWYLAEADEWSVNDREFKALVCFKGAVSMHLAHVAIKGDKHPGDWPVGEASALVALLLNEFLVRVRASDPSRSALFDEAESPLMESLGRLRGLGFRTERGAESADDVSCATRLLEEALQHRDP